MLFSSVIRNTIIERGFEGPQKWFLGSLNIKHVKLKKKIVIVN